MSQEEMDYNDDDDNNAAQQTVLPDADEHTARIMLSTDNHLGYNERDPVRGMDSFAAFEEVLYLAKRFHCDMVLFAGDLFHDNKPSRHTLFKAMEIIRRYCMGDNPVRIQILSDQAKNFSTGVVNYQDPNYSVDLPIFSIHGNHDDPVRDGGDGQQALAALDLLSVANLVNYMGKQDKVDQVEISPVLLQKGTTKIALYGLGSMRDERLNRMWNSRKVRFLRPVDDADDDDEDDDEDPNDQEKQGFFNIFTLHQNRDLGRGSKNCIQESMLPEFLDLIVWGHEHECLIDFSESVVGTFRITQPGSSVATSLVAGESVRKKVGILDIMGKQFRLHKVPLTQVRAFVTADLSLKEHRVELDADDPRIDERVTAILEEEVRVMALNARDKRKEVLAEALAAGSDAGTEDSPLKCKLHRPQEVLVRLRVEHSGFTTLNNQRFGAKFVGDVANPEDILLFHRKKDPKAPAGTSRKSTKAVAPIPPEELAKTDIEDLVNNYLEAPESKLELLSETTLGEALGEFVDKSLGSSMDDAADVMLDKRQKTLMLRKNDPKAKGAQKDDSLEQDESVLEEEADGSHRAKKQKASRVDESLEVSFDNNGKENSKDEDLMEDDNDVPPVKQRSSAKRHHQELDSDMDDPPPPPKSTRAAPAKKGARAAPGDPKRKAARRQKLVDVAEDDDDDDSEVEIVEKLPAAKSRATRGRRVNYSVADDDDDDDGEEDAYRGGDNDDDDDDDLSDPVEKPKRTTKKTSTAAAKASTKKTQRKPATTTKGTARRAPRSTKSKKHKFDDDSDDDVMAVGSTADFDDNWGSAQTRSRF